MDTIQSLANGFSIALLPSNLLVCFIGVFVGTLVGILPGLGPPATLAMILPLAYGMDGTAAMILMCGVFYGARYGGAVTSVLMNLPGETSSVMTCLDGYQMARQGRAGPALGMAAIASFSAGTLGVLCLMLLAPAMSEFALGFGPPEYFALTAMALTLVMFLAGRSMIKALMVTSLGLLLSTIGTDVVSGMERLNFGQVALLGGVDFVVATMGLFAIGEILINLEQTAKAEIFATPNRLSELLPSLKELRECAGTIIRCTIIGFLVGVIPGGNPTIATFLAYGTAKALSKDPEVFGKGAICGVAAPESADNAACSGGLVPLLTLGIPGSGSTAVMLAALMLAGLQPGPLLLKEQPDFFWAVVASMYVGNVLLLIMNLPMVPLFANLMRVPYYIMYPVIVAICCIGAYSIDNSIADVWLMFIFGVIGYALTKTGFPLPPLVLALILGNIMEKSLRQALILLDGNVLLFFNRPICVVLLGTAAMVLVLRIVQYVGSVRSSTTIAE